MNELASIEHFRQLNHDGLMKMISNMTEVPTLKTAQDVGTRMMVVLQKPAGCLKQSCVNRHMR
jgi:hypothetical protein